MKSTGHLEKQSPELRPWVCRECGLRVLATERPAPKRWSDGHTCVYKKLVLEKERDPGPTILGAGAVGDGRTRASFFQMVR